MVSTIRNTATRLAGRCLSRLPGFISSEAGRSVGILMVHGVHAPAIGKRLPPPSSNVDLDSFTANILTAARQFRFISMTEAAAMFRGEMPLRPRCLVLTFDDSLQCLSQLVAPRLHAWGIPAIFYISTGAIDRRKSYWWLRLEYATHHLRQSPVTLEAAEGGRFVLVPGEQRHEMARLKAFLRTASQQVCEALVSEVEDKVGAALNDSCAEYPYGDIMTWDKARSLSKAGFELGSHTVTHPNLSRLTPESLRDELESSRKRIEETTAAACRHCCYPYGAHSEAVCDMARTAGYETAVTTIGPGFNRQGADLFRLRRFAMPGEAYKLSWLLSRMANDHGSDGGREY